MNRLCRHRADLRVHRGVDLPTPAQRPRCAAGRLTGWPLTRRQFSTTTPTLAPINRVGPRSRAEVYRNRRAGRPCASPTPLTYKWTTWQHNNKPKRWIVEHYFGKRNRFRNDRWVFGDPASDAYLVKFSWTDIVRHVMVTGAASPDDPALADYWAERRRKVKPPLDNYTLRLLARQDARCPLCGDHLLTAEQPPQSPNDWERWWQQVTRQATAADYLVHHGRSATAQ